MREKSKRKFLNQLIREYQNPCPGCSPSNGTVKILPCNLTFLAEELKYKGDVTGKVYHPVWFHYICNRLGHKEIPPEMPKEPVLIDCPKCKGQGYLDTDKSLFLKELLKRIGAQES
jgi:hypothetical protein